MDGSALRTSDTAGNRGHLGIWAFGHLGTQEYASGLVASYPQMRMLTLTSLATHLLRDAVLGEYGKNVDAPCQRAD